MPPVSQLYRCRRCKTVHRFSPDPAKARSIALAGCPNCQSEMDSLGPDAPDVTHVLLCCSVCGRARHVRADEPSLVKSALRKLCLCGGQFISAGRTGMPDDAPRPRPSYKDLYARLVREHEALQVERDALQARLGAFETAVEPPGKPK